MGIQNNSLSRSRQFNNQQPEITAVDDNSSLTRRQPSDFSSKTQINGSKLSRKIKKRSVDEASSASSSSSIQRGIRIAHKRRNPRFCVRRSSYDVEAIAFPLGMSIAAVLDQILEKDLTSENAAIDHLAAICSSAVRESLTNVFGDKFEAFARNFEKSFGSTLSTLRLIKKTSIDSIEDDPKSNKRVGDCISDATQASASNSGECSTRIYDIIGANNESISHEFETFQHMRRIHEVKDRLSSDSRNWELSLHEHTSSQIVPNKTNFSGNHLVAATLEKSVVEQTRANDLKSVEIGLMMKKLQLKETQLALKSDLNFLERCKLSLGISRTSFKAEKFKNHLEETRHSELLKVCADFLVADLLIMSSCLGYGVYAFSYDNLRQLTRSCSASEVSKSWWIPKPMASFNSGLQSLNCQVQVYSRMLFGLFMILAIAYVLIQRSTMSKQAMPITFLILLLGIGCGFAGKLCVDTLGGDGYHWLIYWEVLCILHFFINVFTSFLFYVLNGAIQVAQEKKSRPLIPFWVRRSLFYIILIVIPLCCGLLPFASPRTWWEEHFSKLIRNHLLPAYDETYEIHGDAIGNHE